MKSDIGYYGSYTTLNTLNIKSIGNCSIEATNDDGDFFYLVVFSSSGKTYIATCGPVTPDIEELKTGFSCSLTIIDFNEVKLYRIIKFWLNNKNYKITSAQLIARKEALAQFRDLGTYLTNFDAEEDNFTDTNDTDDIDDLDEDENEDN
jgi:hypothetical protein